MLLIVVFINDPSFLHTRLGERVFLSLRWSQASNYFSLVAEFHLKCWDVSISPLQDYSFRGWFSNNSVITFLQGWFPIHFWKKLAFPSPFCYSNDLSSILFSEGIVMLLSHSSSRIEDRVLFMLIHLTECRVFFSSSFSSYQVLHLFSTGVLYEFVLPFSLFISFQPEWFQFLLVHCTRHS